MNKGTGKTEATLREKIPKEKMKGNEENESDLHKRRHKRKEKKIV